MAVTQGLMMVSVHTISLKVDPEVTVATSTTLATPASRTSVECTARISNIGSNAAADGPFKL